MKRGLTLIETVVAATMLSLALLAIMTIIPSTNAIARQAEIRLQADNLAQSLLEKQRLRPFADLAPQPPTDLAVVKLQSFPDLQPSLEIRSAGAGGRAREIRVAVRWVAFNRPSQLTRATVVTAMRR